MPECRRHAVFQLNIIYSALKGQDDFVKMYSRGEFCAAAAPFLWKMPGKNREYFLTIQARLIAPLGPEGQGGGFDSPSLPPGCGALFLLRAAQRPRKKQTAAPAPPRLFLPQAAPRLRSLWTPYPNDQGSSGDRVQWTKQGAAAGAALQFLQAPAAARSKNRLSARGWNPGPR